MNVLYLHQYFATRSGAGGTRSYEFSRALLRRGHRVTMVTARRHNSGIGADARQDVDGINVVQLGGQEYSNRLSMRRRLQLFAQFTWQASRLRASDLPSRPDVVFATSTPLTIGIPGALLARRLRVPFVFEVRDLWPEAPIQLGVLRNPVAKWLARRLEHWCYRRADHVIALSPGMERGVLEAGTPATKVSTIPNASDTDLFGPDHRDRSVLERWGIADRFVVVHGGTMGMANGLDYVVRAAAVLWERGIRDVQFLLPGDGGTRPALEADVARLGLDNVTFAGQIPRGELGAVVSSCDVALVSFADFPILATNSPNKFFDGLAAGLPVIVNSPGWTRDIVEGDDAGAYVDVREPAELADAVVRLQADAAARERQGRNARRLAEEVYARSLLANQFCTVLEQAAGAPGAAATAVAGDAGGDSLTGPRA